MNLKNLKKAVSVLGFIVGCATIASHWAVGWGLVAFFVPVVVVMSDFAGCSQWVATILVMFIWAIFAVGASIALLSVSISVFLSLIAVLVLLVLWVWVTIEAVR